MKRGFTLNEMLIVIAIIVLMIMIGLPAFNALNGSKSTESGSNQISAFLGSVRAQAIGVQEIRGVMFYIDPGSGRVGMVQVRDSGYTAGDGVTYLDVVSGSDFVLLPTGVGVQTLDNCAITGGVRTDDGYIGYNTSASASGTKTSGALTVGVSYGGVILFDAYGKLTSVRYGFRCSTSSTNAGPASYMASFLTDGTLNNYNTGTTFTDFVLPSGISTVQTFSQIGVALYLNDAFNSAGGTLADTQIDGGSYTTAVSPNISEQAEESWIDSNATLMLINRYNGTLIKGD